MDEFYQPAPRRAWVKRVRPKRLAFQAALLRELPSAIAAPVIAYLDAVPIAEVEIVAAALAASEKL